MNKLHKNEQSGRSMVEMLGVLAIIGVLSIGGISGYSKAMSKFRINKTLDQVSMLVMNIRSLFASSLDYKGLNNLVAYTMGIIPGEMLKVSGAAPTAADGLVNAFQGSVVIASAVAADGIAADRGFSITYSGLTQEACVSIATADWGSQSGSGLYSIKIGAANARLAEEGDLPVNVSTASTECGGTIDGSTSIKWVYY